MSLIVACLALPVVQYVRYTNVRFAFHVDYPATLKPGPEPANGDGREFSSHDGRVELLVYGSNNLDNLSAKAMLKDELVAMAKRHVKPSMVQNKADWYALSWIEGGAIRYTKAFVTKDDSIHLAIRYPVGQKKAMDPVVAKVVKSFGRL